MQVISVRGIALDRGPLIYRVGAVLLGFGVAFFHNFRVTVAFVDCLLLADIVALIAAGDIIGTGRRTAWLVVIVHGADLLDGHGGLPMDIGHGRLDGFGGEKEK